MNKDIDLFLKYMASIYLENKDQEISSDTIYNELRQLSIISNKIKKIKKENLLKVQLTLKKEFYQNTLISSRNRYFYTFENRENNSDQEFYKQLESPIKLYIQCSAKELYEVASKISNYILKEKIICQCKIAKDMRNDAYTIRVSKKEDAEKIINYANTIINSESIKNPFIYSVGKVGVTCQSKLSYNYVLSLLIQKYLKHKKDNKDLANVDSSELSKFIRSEILAFKSGIYDHYKKEYNLEDSDISSFINISTTLADTIDNKLTLDKIFKYQDKTNNIDSILLEDKTEEKVLYIIYRLSVYYSTTDIHNILIHYFQNNNANIFTRKDSIRHTIISGITPDKMKNTIIKIGTNALYESIYLTRKKYNNKQCIYAIEKYLLTGKLDGFTRDTSARSKLGLVVPSKYLIEIMQNELDSKNKDILKLINKLSNKDKQTIMKVIDNNIKSLEEEEIIKLEEIKTYIDLLGEAIYESISNKIPNNQKIGIK